MEAQPQLLVQSPPEVERSDRNPSPAEKKRQPAKDQIEALPHLQAQSLPAIEKRSRKPPFEEQTRSKKSIRPVAISTLIVWTVLQI